jgi:hypothetical protein
MDGRDKARLTQTLLLPLPQPTSGHSEGCLQAAEGKPSLVGEHLRPMGSKQCCTKGTQHLDSKQEGAQLGADWNGSTEAK